MAQTPPPPPPPPPPAEWSAPRPAAGFSVGDAVSYGWTAYWQNVGPLALMAIVIFLVNLVIGIVGRSVDDVPGLIALNLLSFVVGIVLALGLIRASLAVTEGRTPEVGMLFRSEGFGPYFLATIVFVIGYAIGLVLLIVPGIIFAIACQFYGYVIAERGDAARPIEALKRSADITRGYRWPLFGLLLLLLLINLVGALACGVGLIFTYGITAVTIAYAYKTLSGQPVAPAG
jgi:uncharacterized membrane protein